MLTTNKHLREILKRAEAAGWSFKLGAKHIKGQRHGKTVTISKTPGDHHAIKNILKDLQA
jgi:hypothetical protein